MTVLHCSLRLVHWPLAHFSPWPQPDPSGRVWSVGHVAVLPVQRSSGSHDPVDGRHTVLADASWHLEQQSSLESSHTAPLLNLHVVGSQHGLSPHPAVPPQSQSSPLSTMPLPHCWPVMVVTSRLSVKHDVLTLLRNMAEQMLPTVQAEKVLTFDDEAGFIMYACVPSHVLALSGQHCCELTTDLSEHVSEVQSCTAPNIWPGLVSARSNALDCKRAGLVAG